jgi:hypothetical protein
MNASMRAAVVSVPLALAAAHIPLVWTAAAAAPEPNEVARSDRHMQARLPSLRTPGVAVLVVEGDRVRECLRRRGRGPSGSGPLVALSLTRGRVSAGRPLLAYGQSTREQDALFVAGQRCATRHDPAGRRRGRATSPTTAA